MTTDQDATRIIRSWLRVDEHESADRILDTVVALLDATPQRRPWWPARRIADMNGYLKLALLAAAVVVVAVVGINLFFTPQGDVATPAAPSPSPSAEPSEAGTGPSGPVVVTAEISGGSDIGKTTYTEVDGRVERRGTVWDGTISASDPRLQGGLTMSVDQDAYPGADGPESFVLGSSTYRLETADGAWQGAGSNFAVADVWGGGTLVLVGEGAYAGLYAALDMTDAAEVNGVIDGVIFPAPPPPIPAAP